MKTTKFALVFLISVLFFASCKKDVDNTKPDQPKEMDELVIPNDFNWSTTQSVQLTVKDESNQVGGLKSKISVFNGNPSTDGKLMSSGSVSASEPFTENLMLPAYYETLFLVKEDAFGQREDVEVSIVGGVINYTFNDTKSSDVGYKSVTEDPDCTTDCDVQVTQTSGTLNIEGGLTYCLSGNFNGSIDFKNSGGTLKICGNVVSGNVNMNKATHHLIITQGGSFEAADLGFGHEDATITVYSNSTLTVNNNFTTKGTLINYGVVNVNGSFNNTAGIFENYGAFYVTGNMSLTSPTTNINGCKIIVNGSFDQNKGGCIFIMQAGSYLEAGDQLNLTKDDTYFYDGAMMKCHTYSSNSQSNVYASGTTSIIQVESTVDINGNMDGPIEVIYNDGITPSVSGNLTNGAAVVNINNSTTYIVSARKLRFFENCFNMTWIICV